MILAEALSIERRWIVSGSMFCDWGQADSSTDDELEARDRDGDQVARHVRGHDARSLGG